MTNPYFFLPAERGRLSDEPTSQHNGHNSKKCRTPFGYGCLSIKNSGKFLIMCFPVCPINDLHIVNAFLTTRLRLQIWKICFTSLSLFFSKREGLRVKRSKLANSQSDLPWKEDTVHKEWLRKEAMQQLAFFSQSLALMNIPPKHSLSLEKVTSLLD